MFGFGKGKMDIRLDNFNYSPGDTIQGSVSLSLKKALPGKEVSIQLVSEEKITEMQGTQYNSRTVTLLDVKQSLSGVKEYPAEPLVYPFKMKIPENLKSPASGALGTIFKAAQLFSGSRSKITWYLIARLDVKGFDITKKREINVG